MCEGWEPARQGGVENHQGFGACQNERQLERRGVVIRGGGKEEGGGKVSLAGFSGGCLHK